MFFLYKFNIRKISLGHYERKVSLNYV